MGTSQRLLSRCGVKFERDWYKIPPNRMIMFPLEPTHPLLTEPNSGLTFTDVTSIWWNPTGMTAYDIGDWVKITGTGDAQLILGTLPTENTTHGMVTVCIRGQLILQTFSSHQITYADMRPLWENYIYNGLKVRITSKP